MGTPHSDQNSREKNLKPPASRWAAGPDSCKRSLRLLGRGEILGTVAVTGGRAWVNQLRAVLAAVDEDAADLGPKIRVGIRVRFEIADGPERLGRHKAVHVHTRFGLGDVVVGITGEILRGGNAESNPYCHEKSEEGFHKLKMVLELCHVKARRAFASPTSSASGGKETQIP